VRAVLILLGIIDDCKEEDGYKEDDKRKMTIKVKDERSRKTTMIKDMIQ